MKLQILLPSENYHACPKVTGFSAEQKEILSFNQI